MMKLKQLFHEISVEIKGKKEIEIRGICSHSKKVAPGDLFLARKGNSTDGTLFIEEAIRGGAVAILTDLHNPFLNVTQVIHPQPHLLEAILGDRFYKHPSKELFLVGVTGTNGKTTTSYIVQHLLSRQECGLIGTIETVMNDRRLPSLLTTPDAITLSRYLREMKTQGCHSCVMEVSSHALIQRRVDALDFDVGVFTNLSQDHLDYHGTMEQYAEAKSRLFTKLIHGSKQATAVVNCDDPWMHHVVHTHPAHVITYGIHAPHARLKASHLQLMSEGSQFEVTYNNQHVTMTTQLVGRFNVYNCLAAMGVALAKGLSLEEIQRKLRSMQGVWGRLERVHYRGSGHVYVDFAHTELALENALQTLREFKQGRMITVVGCGGDRDQGKRPKMGRIAAMHSDVTIFTSDNPRSEDPSAIAQQMLAGVHHPKSVIIELDRRRAIEKALSLAQEGDIILIAGKGHELTQTFRDRTIPFSDRTVVEEYSAGAYSVAE